ncbi:MAG: lipoyl domain-containing protein, partial [Stappiaceae bacterium]
MPHEIIMPALGMAQDTGLIVAWHKNSGDPVAIGDVLMEVETDKSTMEVEAQAQGYLTNVKAAAGDNVPVGNVIALIS